MYGRGYRSLDAFWKIFHVIFLVIYSASKFEAVPIQSIRILSLGNSVYPRFIHWCPDVTNMIGELRYNYESRFLWLPFSTDSFDPTFYTFMFVSWNFISLCNLGFSRLGWFTALIWFSRFAPWLVRPLRFLRLVGLDGLSGFIRFFQCISLTGFFRFVFSLCVFNWLFIVCRFKIISRSIRLFVFLWYARLACITWCTWCFWDFFYSCEITWDWKRTLDIWRYLTVWRYWRCKVLLVSPLNFQMEWSELVPRCSLSSYFSS